ncbi:metallophosphoesterase [Dietzia sp. ANT_WB102]|uniref:metallophosphoesterase n=1 Tax=Dietzia sp. ANT_WB102 TaxID=2597345 RepID=UPI0011EE9968|nr:metallophosphoesterase [Dietzia sp. ANT_WB102]KAA0917986.1 metallophosphoesterase [Dietzia sp. ANT_WB102]
MPRPSRKTQGSMTSPARAAAVLAGTVVAGAVYATGWERNAFTLRRHTLPLLAAGSQPLTILHISDLHMMPGQKRKQQFVASLAALEPDLVVNTGDNLSDVKAVPSVVQSLGPLLARPGAFVFGSNDYFAPVPKNPLPYIGIGRKKHSTIPLPWRDLKAAFTERGWVDATHKRSEIAVDGRRVLVTGVDDPHIGRDRYNEIAGPAGPAFDLRIGLLHSPEPRVLDRFDADGYDLALAGHTHGGQLCLPTGAIVTNCGIDRSRAQGLSAWGRNLVLHVSAGLGTSPYVPVRTFCRPEATLLELVAAPGGGGEESKVPVTPQRVKVPLPV